MKFLSAFLSSEEKKKADNQQAAVNIVTAVIGHI